MDQEGSKEDSVHCLSRIRQVRCLPWGWTRHSHCGTCAVTNIHPARYRRHSSRCSSRDWDLCSVLHCFGQPGQPLLLPLSWPPHLALCSSQEQEWVGAGRQSAARCFTSGVSCCTCTLGYPWQGPGGRAGQNPAEADTMGKTKEEEFVSMVGGFYRWLVSPSSQRGQIIWQALG